MRLVEEYQQLVDRDAVEISNFWKYTQMFFYLLCMISGYISSILFYTIWADSFGGDCLLWEDFILLPKIHESDMFDMYEMKSSYAHWSRYVVVDTKLMHKCTIYLITCFSSCIFGIIWFTFFLIFGKGGYNVAINESSWRIVLPAILFNFIFAVISISENYNFQQGFKVFYRNMQNIFYEVYNSSASKDVSDCEIIQTYTEMYHFHEYNVCDMLLWQQMFSNLMMWSWVAGLILLLLRVTIIIDFRILKVTIYELPFANILDSADKNEIMNNNAEENKKKV